MFETLDYVQWSVADTVLHGCVASVAGYVSQTVVCLLDGEGSSGSNCPQQKELAFAIMLQRLETHGDTLLHAVPWDARVLSQGISYTGDASRDGARIYQVCLSACAGLTPVSTTGALC